MLGPIELVTPPTGSVIGLAEAKKHLRVEIPDDDALIQRLIRAATTACELEIAGHRQFLSATFDVQVEDWWDGKLKLPRPPLQSITSVKYFDAAGVEQTLGATNYIVRKPWRQPGTIEWAPSVVWPDLELDRSHPITIRFVAGYGGAANVPETIKQAILLLLGHWFENREAQVAAVGMWVQNLEFSVKALLEMEGYGFYG
jgi:uncharacterized phiE125 gp8 family phage protein